MSNIPSHRASIKGDPDLPILEQLSGKGNLPLAETEDSAALGSQTYPQMDGVVRVRHAALHLSYVRLPPPLQVGRCIARGSRRRWCYVFPKRGRAIHAALSELRGEGNRVPPRTKAHS